MKMHWSITHLLFGDRYKTFRFHAAFVLYVLIVGLGSIPGARAEVGQFASGLVLHGLAYSIVTFLLFTGSDGRPLGKALTVWVIIAIMGALDEFVQSFLPYRHAAVHDWMVDVTAGFATVFLLWIIGSEILPTNSLQNDKTMSDE